MWSGLAGIGGTLWSGKRSINAEDNRAMRADKKQTYARYMAAVDNFILEWRKLSNAHGQMRKLLLSPTARLRTTTTTLWNTYGEVQLIAPKGMIPFIREVYAATVMDDDTDDSRAKHKEVFNQLLTAMRADLGVTD